MSEPVDNIPGASDNGNGIINALSGILSKAADTYVDQLALNGKTTVGSAYPTGQVNPAAAAVKPVNYTPWLIGGGIALALVIAFVALKK